MARYICNSNGDWWEIDESTTYFILDTEDAAFQELFDKAEIKEIINGDKFADYIREYGNETELEETN
jgi:hypothetical protein